MAYHTSWWRHQMETFSKLLAICAGNSPVSGEFPAQRPVGRRALMFSLICAWINGWVNNCEAGDLRRHSTHYDVPVIFERCLYTPSNSLESGLPESLLIIWRLNNYWSAIHSRKRLRVNYWHRNNWRCHAIGSNGADHYTLINYQYSFEWSCPGDLILLIV